MSLSKDFNSEIGGQGVKTAFYSYLEESFDAETALKVVGFFQKMGLPVPRERQEFMEGYEGGLVFLNRYGLVIRIEGIATRQGHLRADRINDSPWILQPLATIDAGKAIIELCPGCHYSENNGDMSYLHDALLKQGHAFWDNLLGNVGLLPVKTPRFPDGIPIVIDRLAVKRLTEDIEAIRQSLTGIDVNDDETREATETQERLYAPLRRAFDEGWIDSGKMSQFWALCQECVHEGKLVAGWNEPRGFLGVPLKTLDAAEKAEGYDKRLKLAAEAQQLKPPPSGGPS